MRNPYSTKAREQIAEIVRGEHRYLSAAQIFAKLQKQHVKLALSTVYRTLEHLRARGEVNVRVDADGEARYVSCGQTHHHHAICNSCGRVEDVDCSAVERIASALSAHNGFKLEEHSMEFFGRCARCG